MPAIIEFLGYRPFAEPMNLAERLTEVRRLMGWTIKEAARELGVDVCTWGEWERKGLHPVEAVPAYGRGFSDQNSSVIWTGNELSRRVSTAQESDDPTKRRGAAISLSVLTRLHLTDSAERP
jgi:transcriptional regulator with XRE-family HTH domain